MKLNNKGWGLGVFIGFLCFFIILLIVIEIIISKDNDYVGKVDDNKNEINEIKKAD